MSAQAARRRVTDNGEVNAQNSGIELSFFYSQYYQLCHNVTRSVHSYIIRYSSCFRWPIDDNAVWVCVCVYVAELHAVSESVRRVWSMFANFPQRLLCFSLYNSSGGGRRICRCVVWLWLEQTSVACSMTFPRWQWLSSSEKNIFVFTLSHPPTLVCYNTNESVQGFGFCGNNSGGSNTRIHVEVDGLNYEGCCFGVGIVLYGGLN